MDGPDFSENWIFKWPLNCVVYAEFFLQTKINIGAPQRFWASPRKVTEVTVKLF